MKKSGDKTRDKVWEEKHLFYYEGSEYGKIWRTENIGWALLLVVLGAILLSITLSLTGLT